MITTRDQLIDSMGNNNSRIVIDKATIASQGAGTFVSLWRATGQPGQGAIPSTAAVCDNTLTGAMQFTQQTSPATSYLAWLNAVTGNAAMVVEIHDRLMHMGGLSGTVTTAQTVGLDVSANLATANLDNRKGDSNYSDIQWWLEWYTATGATAVTVTVNVTYNDASTGNLTAISLAATRPASFMQPLNSYIPAASSGKYIRAVNSVTLSATTATAGSFGITATKPRTALPTNIANKTEVADWAQCGLPEIPNSSCLQLLVLTSTTSSGTVRGGGKIVHG
jgi:hypothetical protein